MASDPLEINSLPNDLPTLGERESNAPPTLPGPGGINYAHSTVEAISAADVRRFEEQLHGALGAPGANPSPEAIRDRASEVPDPTVQGPGGLEVTGAASTHHLDVPFVSASAEVPTDDPTPMRPRPQGDGTGGRGV